MKKQAIATLTLIGMMAGTGTDAMAWRSVRRSGNVLERFQAHRSSYGRFASRDRNGRDTRGGPMMPWRERTMDTVANDAPSPDTICSSVKRRVRYQRDIMPEDSWKTAESTWEDRSGDCEDFAVLVKDMCARKNMPATVYRFYPPQGSGHAVTIGRWQGRMWMSSNGSYVEVYSIDDAKHRVADKHGWNADLVTMKKGEKSRKVRVSMAW
jgi:predicted transglutaminase-like cysteine proteinase